MTESSDSMSENKEQFFAVCHDCGNLKDESFDHKPCSCGGIYHVDTALCSKCGKRHNFNKTGTLCGCEEAGEIVPKIVRCPSCHNIASIDHLGEFCGSCNVQLVMEG